MLLGRRVEDGRAEWPASSTGPRQHAGPLHLGTLGSGRRAGAGPLAQTQLPQP